MTTIEVQPETVIESLRLEVEALREENDMLRLRHMPNGGKNDREQAAARLGCHPSEVATENSPHRFWERMDSARLKAKTDAEAARGAEKEIAAHTNPGCNLAGAYRVTAAKPQQ